MPRAAGNSTHYEYVLRDYRGRYDRDSTIRLPSVTSVIGATIAKPELVGWAAKVTRDNISGMVAVLMEDEGCSDAEILDMLQDGDWLAEYLKENGITADDVRDAAAELGTSNHESLEHLAQCYLNDGEEAAETVARRMLRRTDKGHVAAICGWWLSEYPKVVAAEKRLVSLRLGVAGTVDLVLDSGDGLCVVDLKTRGAGKVAYKSDHVQVDGYTAMYEEMTGVSVADRAVFVAREDGSWDWYPNPLPRGVFGKTKELYDMLKGVR
jgi:hypothetical protein